MIIKKLIANTFTISSQWINKKTVKKLYSSTSNSQSTILPTIYALTTGLNRRCAVAVIRVSGTKCINVMSKLILDDVNKLEPRKMYLKDLYHPVNKEKIDKALVVWFKSPNSFTGEDVCELHVHGGNAIINTLFNALSTIKGIRHAEAGEFSKRALLNGKMDLTECEGLNDLINADTEMQRKQALNQMEGSLSKLYTAWKTDIVKCLANVEAFIDFHEEENIEDDILDEVQLKLYNVKMSIEAHLNDNRKGERLRNGVRVVIIGEPNAGKSSLLNNICQRPAAIVSPIPGTTRDIIESALNIAGYPILLTDTAGLRETSDIIEKEGVKRAIDRIKTADIIILVIDVNKYLNELNNDSNKFILKHFNSLLNENEKIDLHDKIVICAFNKIDLIKESKFENKFKNDSDQKVFMCKTSSINDENGIDDLLNVLKLQIINICSNASGETPTLTQQRHRDNLIKCVESIEKYLKNIKLDNEYQDIVLLAEQLRNASKYLGTITGHVSTENILDVIFRDFCIGK